MRSELYPAGEYSAPWEDDEDWEDYEEEGPEMPGPEGPDWDNIPDYWEGERL